MEHLLQSCKPETPKDDVYMDILHVQSNTILWKADNQTRLRITCTAHWASHEALLKIGE